MLTVAADNLISAATNLSLIADKFANIAEENKEPWAKIKVSHYTVLSRSLLEVQAVATRLKMDATISACKTCLDLLKNPVYPNDFSVALSLDELRRLTFDLYSLHSALISQLESRVFYAIPSDHRSYLESDSEIFGKEVDDSFPLAQEDIAEAGKCLALGRYTATVFHLMRAMECAVQLLASQLGVANTDKEWGKLLSDISSAIEKMPKGAFRDQWSESHSLLYHVKQAWRNGTMHPKKTYTSEEAEAVFTAVRSFMRHLAPLVF